MKVFVDTSFYVARLIAADQWHQASLRAVRRDQRYITSSLVLNETISLLQGRGYFSVALDFLREMRSNPEIQIIYIDPALQSEAWDLFARWGAIGANAVDCVSFALMKNLSIRKAFTFDERFRKAGFEILP